MASPWRAIWGCGGGGGDDSGDDDDEEDYEEEVPYKKKKSTKKARDRSSSSERYAKVAQRVEMTYFPTIAQLPAWKSYLRTSCVEASNRKDERPIVRWLLEVENESKAMKDYTE